jgi:hypothetical protein
MSTEASMINLQYEGRLVFAVPVPEWSTQHELQINSVSSWIKFPSPKGWDWLKLPLSENYEIMGLSTPSGFKLPDGSILNKGNEVYSTIIRSHIVTNAPNQQVVYQESGVYLILEMFIRY